MSILSASLAWTKYLLARFLVGIVFICTILLIDFLVDKAFDHTRGSKRKRRVRKTQFKISYFAQELFFNRGSKMNDLLSEEGDWWTWESAEPNVEFPKIQKCRWCGCTNCRDMNTESFKDFKETLKCWQRKPYPFLELHRELAHMIPFATEPGVATRFDEFMIEKFPKESKKALAAQAAKEKLHQDAFELQAASHLMKLPRELRDKIWAEALSGNVLHISPTSQPEPSTKRRRGARKGPKYSFHRCVAATGLESTACPPGKGDHKDCSTSGPSDCFAIYQVCRAINMELPFLQDILYSQNALQFSDLKLAENFLFDLPESSRSSIKHLRFTLPYSVWKVYRNHMNGSDVTSWKAICNYFSNPWDRKTLGMYWGNECEELDDLKKPVFFYYSRCYLEQNSDRMHKRWQVGRGDTSWDCGISELKYKGLPKLDLAMSLADEGDGGFVESDSEDDWDQDEEEPDSDADAGENEWAKEFRNPSDDWVRHLLRFRDYDGLAIQFYDDRSQGSDSDIFSKFVKVMDPFRTALVEHLKPKIGPQIRPFFGGRDGYDGNRRYME